MTERSTRELELKLEADKTDALKAALCHPALASVDAKTLKLRAVYFDSPGFALYRAGMSLRLRHDGRRWWQTLKAAAEPTGAVLDRAEQEFEVAGPDIVLSNLENTPAVRALDGQDLQPIFETHIRRRQLHFVHGRSRIEVVVDEGDVCTIAGSVPVAEIELELKSGSPADLFDLARSLAKVAPLRLNTITKAERGYFKLQPDPREKVRADPISLRPEMSVAEAFQTIARSCLKHLLDNERIVRERQTPDAVHQMRVAIRRLRAALSLFKGAVSDCGVEDVKADLRALAASLGTARDLDVYIETILKRPSGRPPAAPELDEAIQRAEAQREKAYEALARDLEPSQLTPLLLSVASWVEAGPWLTAPDLGAARDRPVIDLAQSEIGARWKTVRERSKQIGDMDAETRHRLRILIKKLRYGMEFFESLFGGTKPRKKQRQAKRAVEGLQETLGHLNDLAVASERGSSSSPGEIRDRNEKATRLLIKTAREQAKALADLEPF